jgi:hypothetical protein
MIPPEKMAMVTRGLREAFGVSQFEDIRRIAKGHTPSLVARMVVQGAPYLLKIMGYRGDFARHHACMRAASEAGLAPRIRWAGVEEQIFITDFVEAIAFPPGEALARMPAILRRLHALPPFPDVPDRINTSCLFLLNQGPALDAFLERIRSANIFPKAETEDVFARYAQLAAAYTRCERDWVSSHNDLFKPDNSLFDGERVWLVDWEAAFRNDRYFDLAVVANLVVTNEGEERTYLKEYFGRPPDDYQLARLFLMQQLSHIFYAMAYLLPGSADAPIDWSQAAPDFRDLKRRLWAGEIALADRDVKIQYGRAHLQRLLECVREPRFEESLRIVKSSRPAQGVQRPPVPPLGG